MATGRCIHMALQQTTARWKKVETPGERNGYKDRGGSALNSRRGFGFDIRKYNARPSNTCINRVISGKRGIHRHGARFPDDPRVRMIKRSPEQALDCI